MDRLVTLWLDISNTSNIFYYFIIYSVDLYSYSYIVNCAFKSKYLILIKVNVHISEEASSGSNSDVNLMSVHLFIIRKWRQTEAVLTERGTQRKKKYHLYAHPLIRRL